MSKCTITLPFDDGEVVTFEGATVSEALAMKVEYLLNVGAEAQDSLLLSTPKDASVPSTPKPSGFLNKVKGGTDA